MLQYLVRRILIGCITLLIVTCLGYALIRSIPGDPATIEVESSFKKIATADLQAMRARYGLDLPWYKGYWKWLTDALTGDFGQSISEKKPVWDSIKVRVGPTLLLSSISLTLAYLISIPLGLFATAKSGQPSERALSTGMYMLYSLPAFVAAIILQSWFSVYLQGTIWELPLQGIKSKNYDELSSGGQVWDRFRHLIMPMFCYTYGALAYEMRFIKSNMAEVIRQDYIRTARAKGVSEVAVLWKHGFRNTLIPFLTLLGLTFPALLSGSVILEHIFTWPGIGQLLYQSFTARDYPLIMGLLLVFSTMTLIGQLLADVLYAWADPRISYN
jgi:peptide/nickel transport system permease protein